MPIEREELVRRLRGERQPRRAPWKPVAAVLIAAAVVVAVITLKPWEQGGPEGSNVPSWLEEEPAFAVPEGHVGFRFYSSFTYVSSADNSTLTDVLLKLPMPHVGWPDLENEEFDPGIMWPEIGDWHIPEEDRLDFGVPVYWLHNYRLILYYERDNIRKAQVRDDSALDIKVRPDFTLDYIITQIPGGVKEIKGFAGGRTAAPRMGCLMEATGTGGIYPKARVYVSDLRPGEGVALEGYFSVPENLADDVTLSDWPSEYDDNTPNEIYERTWRGPTWYGPIIESRAEQNPIATQKAFSQLERLDGSKIVSIEKWGGTIYNDTFRGAGKLKWKPDWK